MTDQPKPSTRTPEEILEHRPKWWPAWTDYPHGGFSEQQARDLTKYAVYLEMQVEELRQTVVARQRFIDTAEKVEAELRKALEDSYAMIRRLRAKAMDAKHEHYANVAGEEDTKTEAVHAAIVLLKKLEKLLGTEQAK